MSNYEKEYEKEDDKMNFFKDLATHTIDNLETMVFTTTDLQKLKEKEKNLREKQENKYFRSKVESPKLYEQITKAIAPYLTDTNLKMLAHPWSTQLNEAMNNSVSSYAPKTKNFSGTMSLKTRVGVAAGIQAIGYYGFWKRVFDELDLPLDTAFEHSLKMRDRKKESKRKRQRSTDGKLKQRRKDFAKMDQIHKEQMNDRKTGKTYGAGIALVAAKKRADAKLTSASRNPKGTPKEQLRCPYYHPLYCTKLGHTTASSKDCAMKHKSVDKRKAILAELKKLVVNQELESVLEENGKSILATKYYFFLFSKLISSQFSHFWNKDISKVQRMSLRSTYKSSK